MALFNNPSSVTRLDTKRQFRPDGRWLWNEDGTVSASLRPLTCELSCLHRSDGSSLWKSGATHVMAAVYGPIAPRISSQEHSDQVVVSVIFKSGQFNTTTTSTVTTTDPATANNVTNSNNNTGIVLVEREWEQFLTSVLSACIDTKMYARTVVEVVLQVIQDDGSVLAAALHAAVAALMDAGVAMINLPVATTFLIVPSSNNNRGGENDDNEQQQPSQILLLDPTSEEERNPNASVLIMVTENEDPNRILAIHSMAAAAAAPSSTSSSTISIPMILSCAQAAAKATPAVVTFWRLAMEQRVTRESQTLWSS